MWPFGEWVTRNDVGSRRKPGEEVISYNGTTSKYDSNATQ
jgi:hypothetical protein